MAKSSMSAGGLVAGTAVVAAVVATLAGCAVELQNTQASRELARASQAPGSVYTGWRVFQDKCARCHGPSATGTGLAPDLLPRVRGMGSHRFVGIVLTRYDWSLPPGQTGRDDAARAALVEDIVQRRQGALTMPEWQGEPRVNAHIVDLYAWLSARAEGTQGPERPAP